MLLHVRRRHCLGISVAALATSCIHMLPRISQAPTSLSVTSTRVSVVQIAEWPQNLPSILTPNLYPPHRAPSLLSLRAAIDCANNVERDLD
ncbi:hypothetical protein BU26DRAFT_56613 [Trematosphaeria pertusa]|uniref:Uncharacterized protein n=1 Tax=Trematosphaeria pertusa TaxID=390896 RepID=A0A6A6I9A8_9PLEO|nr:uncharacterized protein BU26DRAFT_56613 [Trematosphaeria pertusa]KAF2246966.1 hypothetical protein BU26DRAFT_56613 [Trematosphaeria pertusa]